MESFKKFSPALYALIIFCFLLPFFNLSCSGQKVMSLTGLQMVTGTHYEQQNMFGGGRTKKIEAEPLAIFALLAAIIGLVIGFMKMKNINLFSVIISIVGALFLFLLKNKLDNDVIAQGQGMIKIEYEFGYWFSLLLFIAAAIIQGLIYNQEKKTNAVKIEPSSNV
jgi:hypothetical protein